MAGAAQDPHVLRRARHVGRVELRSQRDHAADGQPLCTLVDDITIADHKTKGLIERFGKMGLSNALIIGGAEVDVNFGRAARAIPMIDVLPVQGINVYDILRRDTLVLTKAAVDALEERFK